MKKKADLFNCRLNKDDKMVAGYIYNRCSRLFRNSNGKPVYSRNLDQVIKDIFGVKKFTKLLEAGRYNEGKMYNLFHQLIDLDTMWNLCRSNRNYELLSNMVALDHSIVADMKKLEQYKTLEPAERPTKKMRKLAKRIKADSKTYKAAIRTIRDMYDVKRYNPEAASDAAKNIRNFLDDASDNDIFGDDFGYTEEDIETMDAYVAKHRAKRRGGKKGRNDDDIPSAFGLGRRDDDDEDIFDDFGEEDDDEDDEVEIDERTRDALTILANRSGVSLADVEDFINGERSNLSASTARAARPASSSVRLDPQTEAIVNAITQGFSQMNHRLDQDRDELYNALADDDDDDGYVEEQSIPMYSRPSSQAVRPSIADIMDEADQANADTSTDSEDVVIPMGDAPKA